MKLLSQILNIYNWGAVSVLLLFLFGIARFFEQRLSKKLDASKKYSYYQYIIIPLVLFLASAVIYSRSEILVVGNLAGDGMRIVGSIVFGYIGYLLMKNMLGGRS